MIASLSEAAGAQRIERWSSVLEAEVLPLYDTPIWHRRRDLPPQPSDRQSDALLLSYVGKIQHMVAGLEPDIVPEIINFRHDQCS